MSKSDFESAMEEINDLYNKIGKAVRKAVEALAQEIFEPPEGSSEEFIRLAGLYRTHSLELEDILDRAGASGVLPMTPPNVWPEHLPKELWDGNEILEKIAGGESLMWLPGYEYSALWGDDSVLGQDEAYEIGRKYGQVNLALALCVELNRLFEKSKDAYRD